MTSRRARPLPATFPVVVDSLGLTLSIVSGPTDSDSDPVPGYVLELRRNGATQTLVRFPYAPGPFSPPEIALVDVLFDVMGDVAHCERRQSAEDPRWASDTLHVPAALVDEIATALERSLGAVAYRLLRAEYETEEREWLQLMAGPHGSGSPSRPSRPRTRSRRRGESGRALVSDGKRVRALEQAWHALTSAGDDRERGEVLLRIGEILLGLGLRNAAADALSGAFHFADRTQTSGLRLRVHIAQMLTAALMRREALFEWLRASIRQEALDDPTQKLYDQCVHDGCRIFGRARRDGDLDGARAPLTDATLDEGMVRASMEAVLRALSREPATSVAEADPPCATPTVARIVRALRARASLERAANATGPARVGAQALRRALARAHRSAVGELHARGNRTGVSSDVIGDGLRVAGGPIACAEPYAAALRSALAMGDGASNEGGWLFGTLEASEHYGQALYEAGAPAAAAQWFVDLETITERVAPVLSVHALTWRAALARRSCVIGEARRLMQLARGKAMALDDSELLFAIRRQEAGTLMAVGNFAHAEAAYRALFTEGRQGSIRSSRLIVAVMNDLAITLIKRATPETDRARARGHFLEAAVVLSDAYSFGRGFLGAGHRQLLADNLAACCLELGLNDTAAQGFAAIRRSADTVSLRSVAFLAGALSGEIRLAVLRGDRATFERLCAEAESLRTEAPERAGILQECARGWRHFGEAGRAAAVLDDLAVFAQAHQLNDLLLEADRERAGLRSDFERRPTHGDAASDTSAKKATICILGDALQVEAIALAHQSTSLHRGEQVCKSPVPHAETSGGITREQWHLLELAASLQAEVPERESVERANDLIGAALLARTPVRPCRRMVDDGLLEAIRHFGDSLTRGPRGPSASCAWYSSVLRASVVADRRLAAGWTLAWRARSLRHRTYADEIRDGDVLAAQDYAAALALARDNGFHELALFARHGLAAVWFTRGCAQDALRGLRRLVPEAQALGSKRALSGVLCDLGVATHRIAAAMDDDEARAGYRESAYWFLSAIQAGGEGLMPVQREILLLNLAGVGMALGYEDAAARAAETLLRSTSHLEHRATAAVLLLEAAGRRGDSTDVDRWATVVAAQATGRRAHAEGLLVTGRAYRMIGRTRAARSILGEAAKAACGLPVPELQASVRREHASLAGERVRRDSTSSEAELIAKVNDTIEVLRSAAGIGTTVDWE